MLAIDPSIPIDNISELASYLNSNPDKANYASSNSTGIIAGAALERAIDVDMIHVPYAGTPQAIGDILGGRVSMMFIDFIVGLPQVNSGALKPLAVTMAERTTLTPDLPTMRELGFEEIVISAWAGMFAPKNTPEPIIQKLNAVLVEILDDEAVRGNFAEIGFDSSSSSPEEFAAFIDTEIVHWADLIAKAGIEPQ